MKTSQCTKRIALFQGSFDPFTSGHESIVTRALAIFDEVVVAISVNSQKKPFMPVQQRKAWIEAVFAGQPRVRVVECNGLVVNLAKQLGATCLLRGVRSLQDFESEMAMADANREAAGIETVLLYTLPQFSTVSSSVVREWHKHGRILTSYLPANAPLSLLPPCPTQQS